MTLDPDAVVGILAEDVAELRDLLHGSGLQDRAVAAEQQRRLEVHQDAVLRPLRVGHLLQLLRLLVEVVADSAPGDAAHQRADRRSFPPAGERADARADRGAAARADRGALLGSCACSKSCSGQHHQQEPAHSDLLQILLLPPRFTKHAGRWGRRSVDSMDKRSALRASGSVQRCSFGRQSCSFRWRWSCQARSASSSSATARPGCSPNADPQRCGAGMVRAAL